MILVGCRSMWQGRVSRIQSVSVHGVAAGQPGNVRPDLSAVAASYAIARHMLGQEYLTLEVFAILHLVGRLFRHAAAGNQTGHGRLAGQSRGSVLRAVRPGSYHGAMLVQLHSGVDLAADPVPGARTALPQWSTSVSWRWICGMGLATGLTFHVGFSQAAIYLNSFLCLAVLFLMAVGSLPWRRALAMVPALHHRRRDRPAAGAISNGWPPRTWKDFRSRTGGSHRFAGACCCHFPSCRRRCPAHGERPRRIPHATLLLRRFAGFAVLFPGGRLAFLAHSTWPRRRNAVSGTGQVWTFCAVCALWLGLGDAGGTVDS